MFWILQLVSLLLVLNVAENHGIPNEAAEVEPIAPTAPQHVRSPMVEVLMHLPPDFPNVGSLKRFLGVKPERMTLANEWKRDENPRALTDVRSYEIARPEGSTTGQNGGTKRLKREAEKPNEDKPTAQKLTSSSADTKYTEKFHDGGSTLPMADAMRGPPYSTYPAKEYDILDLDDPDYSRRRRNDSLSHRDENAQRDKRTFLEGEGRGSTTKANDYTPPQHRSAETARESHSLKNVEKSVQQNEVPRVNQDNFYSSTNRRTFSRQTDNVTPSTPKSVYDTIDYSKRNQDAGRSNFVRNYDEKKEIFRDGRPTHEQYTSRQLTHNHPFNDRPLYQPPYPYPTEVVGRGVEYYHRTFEPNSGRIIYYANLPENGRSSDYQYVDPISRSFYVNRPYIHDPYYRNVVPPQYDYRYSNMAARPLDYMRTGRSNSQAYSYPYQERDRYQRDPRFTSGYDRSNKVADDVRNKTYIIYDADDNRSHFGKTHFFSNANRMGYTPFGNNYAGPQPPFGQFPVAPPLGSYAPSGFPYRNQFYPSGSNFIWGYRQGPPHEGRWPAASNNNARALISPEVQLPLSVVKRNFSTDLDSNKKS